jgi:hypothetical protein
MRNEDGNKDGNERQVERAQIVCENCPTIRPKDSASRKLPPGGEVISFGRHLRSLTRVTMPAQM